MKERARGKSRRWMAAAAAGAILLTAGCASGVTVTDRNEAFRLALADAGLSEGEVSVTSQRLEEDGGKSYYEIGFTSDSYVYRYEIDASSGAVTQMSMDAIAGQQADGHIQGGSGQTGQPAADDRERVGEQGDTRESQAGQPGEQNADQSGEPGQESRPGQQGASQAAGEPGQGDAGMPGGQTAETIDSAKVIALTDAGLTEAEVTFTKEKLDWDAGIPVYDIDFYSAEMEYEYEINAFTGAVMERNAERFVNPQAVRDGLGTEGLIGEDRAKEAAATHAGFAVEDVFFTKVKLDRDDRILEYEIEFFKDRVEYEYTIDAASGTILEYDSEYDH